MDDKERAEKQARMDELDAKIANGTDNSVNF
jgi:hypothetical protein